MAVQTRPFQMLNLADMGLDYSPTLVNELTHWIKSNAVQSRIEHTHHTSRDGRSFSYLRHSAGILNSSIDIPRHLAEFVEQVYHATAEQIARHSTKRVLPLPTTGAAVGHYYQPGDMAAEAHVDYYPSATWYLTMPDKGGHVGIAPSPYHCAPNDLTDFENVQPTAGTVMMFDGQSMTHYVASLPATARGDRVSINFSFHDGVLPIDDGPRLPNRG